MSESQGSLTNGDLTTSEGYIILEFGGEPFRPFDATDVLIRYYNDLDANADVALYGTTTDDATYSNGSWDVSGASRWEKIESVGTVSSGGGTDYSTLTDDWEFLRVGVTPATDPTSGDFEVYTVTRDHE